MLTTCVGVCVREWACTCVVCVRVYDDDDDADVFNVLCVLGVCAATQDGTSSHTLHRYNTRDATCLTAVDTATATKAPTSVDNA